MLPSFMWIKLSLRMISPRPPVLDYEAGPFDSVGVALAPPLFSLGVASTIASDYYLKLRCYIKSQMLSFD